MYIKEKLNFYKEFSFKTTPLKIEKVSTTLLKDFLCHLSSTSAATSIVFWNKKTSWKHKGFPSSKRPTWKVIKGAWTQNVKNRVFVSHLSYITISFRHSSKTKKKENFFCFCKVSVYDNLMRCRWMSHINSDEK